MINLRVSKTCSLELEDLSKIQKRIEEGEFTTFSEFVQYAIKNELKSKELNKE